MSRCCRARTSRRRSPASSPTSCGAWLACTSTRSAAAAVRARCTCAAPTLTTRWCWSTACASTTRPMRAAARSTSPPSTSPTSSAWKLRAARIRPCTVVTRWRAWSTSSRDMLGRKKRARRSMPWVAATTSARFRSTPAGRWALTPGTSAPAIRTRARSPAATSSTGSVFPAVSIFGLGASTRAFVTGRYSETSREGFPRRQRRLRIRGNPRHRAS